ncbi:uncharacterized protein SPPG_09072, partial [Spizellomyces punctatus DAOM BR117]
MPTSKFDGDSIPTSAFQVPSGSSGAEITEADTSQSVECNNSCGKSFMSEAPSETTLQHTFYPPAPSKCLSRYGMDSVSSEFQPLPHLSSRILQPSPHNCSHSPLLSLTGKSSTIAQQATPNISYPYQYNEQLEELREENGLLKCYLQGMAASPLAAVDPNQPAAPLEDKDKQIQELTKTVDLLKIQISAFERINDIREGQVSSPDKEMKHLSMVTAREDLLTCWRRKVFELLVHNKLQMAEFDQDRRAWEVKLGEQRQENEALQQQLQISAELLRIKEASLELERDTRKRIATEVQAVDARRIAEHKHVLETVENWMEHVGCGMQNRFVQTAERKMHMLSSRIEFAADRLAVVRSMQKHRPAPIDDKHKQDVTNFSQGQQQIIEETEPEIQLLHDRISQLIEERDVLMKRVDEDAKVFEEERQELLRKVADLETSQADMCARLNQITFELKEEQEKSRVISTNLEQKEKEIEDSRQDVSALRDKLSKLKVQHERELRRTYRLGDEGAKLLRAEFEVIRKQHIRTAQVLKIMQGPRHQNKARTGRCGAYGALEPIIDRPEHRPWHPAVEPPLI